MKDAKKQLVVEKKSQLNTRNPIGDELSGFTFMLSYIPLKNSNWKTKKNKILVIKYLSVHVKKDYLYSPAPSFPDNMMILDLNDGWYHYMFLVYAPSNFSYYVYWVTSFTFLRIILLKATTWGSFKFLMKQHSTREQMIHKLTTIGKRTTLN